MIQILVPMAGESSRFTVKGYIPKPFLPLIDGKSVIEVIEEHLLFLANKDNINVQLSFLIKEEYLNNVVYRSILANLTSKIYKISTPNKGPLCTVSQVINNLLDGDSLIVYDCDQLSLFSMKQLANSDRGVIVTHTSKNNEMSYIGRDLFGKIDRIAEKERISEEASCGVYFFPSVKLFKNAALYDFSHNNSLNNEFRIANLYNYLIKKNISIDSYKAGAYFNLGTPGEYENFIKNNISFYKAYLT